MAFSSIKNYIEMIVMLYLYELNSLVLDLILLIIRGLSVDSSTTLKFYPIKFIKIIIKIT
jgi:hypothetical protein